ncbi:MAG: CbiX/SirB N-terminal domain-containing protein [Giesbergeria sp.]|jgi:sirohydrochlorin cobaltochelatase|nr:CbiX/SirB N-terminal domain-containing protein [Giesbergeria sp.]
MTTPTQGIVLFAHGSRDPLWRAPIEAVEAHIRAHQPAVAVRCAYLELSTPDLPQAVEDLVGQGATAVTIVPMFLGTGKHAREDLPVLVADLRARHPQVQLHVQAAIGEDPRMTALMASIACTPPAP